MLGLPSNQRKRPWRPMARFDIFWRALTDAAAKETLMNPIRHQNKIQGLIQVAQFFLSTSGHQAARRKGMKQNEKIIRRYDKLSR
jgi:hypothetical protein